MKTSEIFLSVAEKVDNIHSYTEWPEFYVKPYICYNATYCCPYLLTDENIRAFALAFKPTGIDLNDGWFGQASSRNFKTLRKRQDHRVFAMLLMREMAKDWEKLNE